MLAVARLFAKLPGHNLLIEDSKGEYKETWKASSSKMEGPKKGSNWRAMLTALRRKDRERTVERIV